MEVALDYNADVLLQGIDTSDAQSSGKRSPHLSHFLLSDAAYNKGAFELILEEDRRESKTTAAKEKTTTAIIDKEQWHVPAIVAVADKFVQESEENLRKAEETEQVREKEPQASANAESNSIQSLEQPHNKIQVFSSDKLNESADSMEESNFLQWIKSKNSESQSDKDEMKDDDSSSQELNNSFSKNEVQSENKIEQVQSETNEAEKSEVAEEINEQQLNHKGTTEKAKTETTEQPLNSESTEKKKSKKTKLKRAIEDSVSMGDEIVSETLANLLAYHGHRERAKEMYEKLRLLFPNKSSYFAKKIQNLKNK